MSKGRLLFCYAILAFVVGGSLYDIVRFREHYPFSPYGMFSEIQMGPVVTQYKAMAVPADGTVPFFLEREAQMEPWIPQRLSLAIQSVADRPDFSRIAKEAARDVMRRYERGRARATHDGPPLKAMVVQRVSWRVRPDVANKRTPDTIEEIARFEPGEL